MGHQEQEIEIEEERRGTRSNNQMQGWYIVQQKLEECCTLSLGIVGLLLLRLLLLLLPLLLLRLLLLPLPLLLLLLQLLEDLLLIQAKATWEIDRQKLLLLGSLVCMMANKAFRAVWLQQHLLLLLQRMLLPQGGHSSGLHTGRNRPQQQTPQDSDVSPCCCSRCSCCSCCGSCSSDYSKPCYPLQCWLLHHGEGAAVMMPAEERGRVLR